MRFERLEEQDIYRLLPYFRAQNTRLADWSAGYLFMWRKYQKPFFAEAEGCLVLREEFVGRQYFYYPLSLAGDAAAEARAVEAVEKYCRDEDVRLHFTNVPAERLPALVLRYGADVHVADIRRWRDYLYAAEDFKSYAGSRFSGQRNHVNKFKKSCPDAEFCVYREEDRPAVEAFLHEVEGGQRSKEELLADEEMGAVFSVLPHMGALGFCAGFVRAGGRILSFAAGERCGDTLMVHIEKAVRDVPGVYPATAQMFAQAFAGEGVNFINREDDAGDAGLRKSKLQYLPVRLVDKYNVTPRRAIDALSHFPEIETPRLCLRAVPDEDAPAYARLARDGELNRYWGYDWRQDAPEGVEDGWFLRSAREDFKRKSELSLGVYAGETLVGEAVLHRFGYAQECEAGVRILPEHQNKGYAREALSALMNYAFLKLGIERAEAKCFRPNAASAHALRGAGMRPCGEDDTYFYFYKTPAM